MLNCRIAKFLIDHIVKVEIFHYYWPVHLVITNLVNFQISNIHKSLCSRGPDVSSSANIEKIHEDISCHLLGYTLHFQGELTEQPISDEACNYLLWNGEVFNKENEHHVIPFPRRI